MDPVEDCTRLDWQTDRLSESRIRTVLTEEGPEALLVTRIPNARMASEIEALDRLANLNGIKTAGDLEEVRRACRGSGVDPDELCRIATDLPYSVTLSYCDSGAAGRMKALYRRKSSTCAIASRRSDLRGEEEPMAFRPWSAYANDPLKVKRARELASRLRGFVGQHLPEYMVPSAVVLLERFPLTPNGKVDRGALPLPEGLRRVEEAYVPPHTEAQRKIAAIWREVLQVEKIGVHDNFFELGGHSLMATQVISRLRDAFALELPLASLFESPTLAGLAEYIETTIRAARDREGMVGASAGDRERGEL